MAILLHMATSSIQHVFLTNLTFIGTRFFGLVRVYCTGKHVNVFIRLYLATLNMYIHDNIYVMITVTITWHCCAKDKGEKITKM